MSGSAAEAARLLARADLDAAATNAVAWQQLVKELMTRLHDGYAVDPTTLTTIDVKKLFYPQWWLELVHYYGPRYYPCYGPCPNGQLPEPPEPGMGFTHPDRMADAGTSVQVSDDPSYSRLAVMAGRLRDKALTGDEEAVLSDNSNGAPWELSYAQIVALCASAATLFLGGFVAGRVASARRAHSGVSMQSELLAWDLADAYRQYEDSAERH